MKSRTSLPKAQLAEARKLLGWTKNAITEKIGVPVGSIGDVELGRGSAVNIDRLIALYEAAGLEFLPDGQVRMKQALKGSPDEERSRDLGPGGRPPTNGTRGASSSAGLSLMGRKHWRRR